MYGGELDPNLVALHGAESDPSLVALHGVALHLQDLMLFILICPASNIGYNEEGARPNGPLAHWPKHPAGCCANKFWP